MNNDHNKKFAEHDQTVKLILPGNKIVHVFNIVYTIIAFRLLNKLNNSGNTSYTPLSSIITSLICFEKH